MYDIFWGHIFCKYGGGQNYFHSTLETVFHPFPLLEYLMVYHTPKFNSQDGVDVFKGAMMERLGEGHLLSVPLCGVGIKLGTAIHGQCRGKLSENFEGHWSIRISPGKGMDQ